MSQVLGLGHVTSYRHSTLFHSPLVGVDKETVATSTLGEKLEEEMNSRNTHGVCDLAKLMVFMKISCRLCDLATLMVFIKITDSYIHIYYNYI